jgi:hypothetical protein
MGPAFAATNPNAEANGFSHGISVAISNGVR